MSRIFRNAREKLLNENKIRKYLKYALGEIMLLVVGILIAFQIEDWNEQRKTDQEIQKIFQRIILDIEDDLTELQGISNYYMSQKPVFDKVIKDSVSIELLDQGLSRLVGTRANEPIFNSSGVAQLKALNTKNNLALYTISLYDRLESRLLKNYEGIEDLSLEFGAELRNANYSWFPEWMSKNIMKDNSSEELQSFFINNQINKNYIADAYNRIFFNYLPSIRFYRSQLIALRTELKKATDENYSHLSPEELAQLTGVYAYKSLSCSSGEFPVDPKVLDSIQLDVKIIGNTIWGVNKKDNDSTELWHENEYTFRNPRAENNSITFLKDEHKVLNHVVNEALGLDCTLEFQRIEGKDSIN